MSVNNKATVQDEYPEWPADGLEVVTCCPVCSSNNREILHEDLTDNIFNTPGKWSLYRCESCASAYIDPRPTPETIGLAYQHYFTHKVEHGTLSPGVWVKLRRRMANGYRNYYYGTRDYPASILGILVASLMPNTRANNDAVMRHLPKARNGQRLLDMGCGNGEFLLKARSAGWDVVGVDFDAKAVEVARSRRLDVRLGGVEKLDPAEEQFDAITLAHVIEHVHHPLEMLKACYKLLRPGGFLWLETPNIASEGHRLFGPAWRGLEPPRHLVLFTQNSMCNALSAAGFSEMKIQPYRPLCNTLFGASKAIAEGADPYSELYENGPPDMVKQAERIAKCDPTRREFITVKAWK
jgi:2-polyprenyl-3-methyl-5-hydroxy-6-metoxy-1,4-benzoquinol methylase